MCVWSWAPLVVNVMLGNTHGLAWEVCVGGKHTHTMAHTCLGMCKLGVGSLGHGGRVGEGKVGESLLQGWG